MTRDFAYLDQAADRLLGQIEHQRWRPPHEAPTPAQVAMVLRALADHTALEQARTYSREYPAGSGTEDTAWPTSLSLGRWLHDVGQRIEDREGGLDGEREGREAPSSPQSSSTAPRSD